MRDNGVFTPISAIADKQSELNGREHLFGTREVNVALAEQTKSSVKMRVLFDKIKDQGILSPDTSFGDNAILHGSTGDPTFVQIGGRERFWYVSAQPIGYDGNAVKRERFNEERKFDQFEIITGICLFGSTSAEGIGENGQTYQLTDPATLSEIREPITTINVDQRIHPYEADSILRLSGFINDAFSHADARLNLHTPRLEYFLYGLALRDQGAFSDTQTKQWFDEVDKRADKVEGMLAKRSRKDVRIVSPLGLAEEYIRTDSHPTLEGVLENLRQDPLWQKLLEKNQPQDMLDLTFLSYTYAYLRLSQDDSAGDEQSDKTNRLLVAVENPEEVRILISTQRNFDIIDKPTTLLGLYVHPEVLTDHAAEKQILYYQPNHDNRRVSSLTQITKTYKVV